MSQELKLPRRKFIQISSRLLLSLAGLLGLGGLIRFFSHEPESLPPSSYNLGPAIEFPPNTRIIRLDIPAVIFQLGSEYKAFSLKCTHLGCTLEDEGEIFSCPCHGSAFDHNGEVLKGPAEEKLPALKVEINEEGNLIVYPPGAGQ